MSRHGKLESSPAPKASSSARNLLPLWKTEARLQESRIRNRSSLLTSLLPRLGILTVILLLGLSFLLPKNPREGRFRVGRVSGEGTLQPCPGDVTLDGQREMEDILGLIRHLLGFAPLEGVSLANADANRDAAVDVGDLVRILQHQMGTVLLESCRIPPQVSGPFIRYLSPLRALPGTEFTLVGEHFDSHPAGNTIRFKQVDELVVAELLSASETVLRGIVPPSLELPSAPAGEGDAVAVPYEVSVTVDDLESNDVGFELTAESSPLDIYPQEAFLLLSPGSEVETFLIRGGTPPYKLLPLEDFEVGRVEVIQEGPVIQVRQIGDSPYGVRLNVEDSADPPATDWADLSKRTPFLNTGLEVFPHSLLAGASPGFEFSLYFETYSMRIREVLLSFENLGLQVENLNPGQILGLVTIYRFSTLVDLQFLQVEEVQGGEATFRLWRYSDPETLAERGNGVITGSPPQILIRQVPDPPPESVFDGDFTFEVLMVDRLLKLPDLPGQRIGFQADFVTTSVRRDQELPLRARLREEFMTQPRPQDLVLDRIYPVRTAASGRVSLEGSGFDTELSTVTFNSFGEERSEAEIITISDNRIEAVVPLNAVSGTVRVETGELVSNEHPIRVLFHATAAMFFDQLTAGQPGRPLLRVDHPSAVDQYDNLLDELSLEIATFSLEGESNIEALALEIDQQVGTMEFLNIGTGVVTRLQVLYAGTEETTAGSEENPRHVFEFRPRASFRNVFGRVFVADTQQGVVFTLENPLNSNGSRFANPNLGWTVEFTEPIYRPPAGATDSILVEARTQSTRWNGLLESNQHVIFRYLVTLDQP